MQILFLVFMFVIGAIFGSFLCCQVRRNVLHRRVTDSEGDPHGAHATWGRRIWQDPSGQNRSICLHCKKKLKWYDNIPIFSWLFLRGKCRFCHKKIGSAEIISELATAISLTLLGTTINVEHATITQWLTFIFIALLALALIFLAIYDGTTGELPTSILILAAILAAISIVPGLIENFSFLPFLSAIFFGGIYLALYLISKGKWVGDGDWILAATIGLALGHPWLSAVALFVANLSACLIMYPLVKKRRSHQIYFGPFLVFAFIITYTFSDFLISVI